MVYKVFDLLVGWLLPRDPRLLDDDAGSVRKIEDKSNTRADYSPKPWLRRLESFYAAGAVFCVATCGLVLEPVMHNIWTTVAVVAVVVGPGKKGG